MAVSTNSIFANVHPGEAGLIKESHFNADSSCKYSLGTQKTLSDGRVFRYAHFGADTGAGLLVAQDFSESGNAEADNIVVVPASANTVTDGTIGSKFVEITLASVTADQFAGGYLHTTDDTGEGYCYRIKGNTATDDPASGS